MKFLTSLITCLLLMFCTSVNAELYKHTDEKGVTTYSDVKVEGAKEITPPKGNTIKLPKYVAKDKKPDEKPVVYTLLAIISPEHDSTIRDNTGNIVVTLSLEPELKVGDGHTISVYISNLIAVSKSTAITHTINNLDRGSHEIYAVINDDNNKPLITSDPVTIHIKRFSTHN